MSIALARAFVFIRGDTRGLDAAARASRLQVLQEMRAIGVGATAALGAAFAGIAATIRSAVSEAGRFEQVKVSFETMLGSVQEAREMLESLSVFATKTPFTIQGTEDAARSLMAVGFEANEIIPTLEMVGNVASGLGRGEDGLRRLVLNLGQVRTQSRLTGRELRDFAVLGVPLIETLAETLGVSAKEVKELTEAGEISADMVTAAFQKMSSSGGRFGNLMKKQSKTMLGMWSNLKDQFTLTARVIGSALLPAAKAFVGVATRTVEAVRIWVERNKELATGALLGAAAFTTLGTAFYFAKVAADLFDLSLMKLKKGLLLGGAIVLIGAAFGVTMAEMREVFIDTFTWFQSKAQATYTAITEYLSQYYDTFQAIWRNSLEVVRNAITGIMELNRVVWGAVMSFLGSVNSVFESVFGVTIPTVAGDAFGTVILWLEKITDFLSFWSTNWKLTWEALKVNTALVLVQIADKALMMGNTMLAATRGAAKGMVAAMSAAAYNIGMVFQMTVTSITGMFKGLWAGIKSKFTGGDFMKGFADAFAEEWKKMENSNDFRDPAKEGSKAFTDEFTKSMGADSPLAGTIKELEADYKRITDAIAAERDKERKDLIERRKPEELIMDKKPKGPKGGRKGPMVIEAKLDPGRYGLRDFGKALQDSLLKDKDDKDKKRNDLLQTSNTIQGQILTATNNIGKNMGLK